MSSFSSGVWTKTLTICPKALKNCSTETSETEKMALLMIHDLRCWFYLIRIQENWEPKNFSMFQQLFSATGCDFLHREPVGILGNVASNTWQPSSNGKWKAMWIHVCLCIVCMYMLYVYIIRVLIYLPKDILVRTCTDTSIVHLYTYIIWLSMHIRTQLKS